MYSFRRVVLALALALPAAACGSPSAPSAAPGTTTDSFSGTVTVGGRDIHSFSVASLGEVDVTLTAAGPPSTIFMGLAIGSFANGTCSLLGNGSAIAQAGTLPQLTGSLDVGTYCIDVFDAGNQTGAVNYSVNVSHY
jgi:hypothetical protein